MGTQTKKRAPRQSTAQKKRLMLDALERHAGRVDLACAAVGIARSTHYLWTSTDPDYRAGLELVNDAICDRAEGVLFEILERGERDSDRVRAAVAILKARGKGRGYGTERNETTLSGELTERQVTTVIFELPDNHTGPGQTAPMPPGWNQLQ